MSVSKAITFLKSLKLSKSQEHISKKVMKNALERLDFLA
jgi:excinuclease UvrABC ATPase subunit